MAKVMKSIDNSLSTFKKQKYEMVICYDTNVFSHIKHSLFKNKNICYGMELRNFRGYNRDNDIIVYGLPNLPKDKLELIESLLTKGYKIKVIQEKLNR